MAQSSPDIGFMTGMNDQRKAEQELEDNRMLAFYRATEAAKNFENILQSRAERDALRKAFEGEDPMGPGVGAGPPQGGPVGSGPVPLGEPRNIGPTFGMTPSAPTQQATPPVELDDFRQRRLADRYDRAAQILAPWNPTRAVAMSNLASNIRARSAHEQVERERIAAGKRGAQADALQAVTGPENYEQGMTEYMQRGGQLPGWYTGDWEKDKDKFNYLKNSLQKANDQQKNELAGARLEAQTERAKADLEVKARNAATAEANSRTQQARAEETRRENERREAATQERLAYASRPTDQDRDMARAEIKSYMTGMGAAAPNLDANGVTALTVRVAAKAKARLATEKAQGKDLGRLIAEEVEKAFSAGGDIEQPPTPQFGGYDIPFMKPNARLRVPQGGTAAPALRSDTSAPRSSTEPSSRPGAPAPSRGAAPPVGTTVTWEGKQYVFQGGDVKDRNNWKEAQ